MAFKKGERRPAKAGRKAGTPNKATASVKEALTEAFAGLGGVPSLLEWAKSEPTEFYRLWGKMLPTDLRAELSGAGGVALVPVITITKSS